MIDAIFDSETGSLTGTRADSLASRSRIDRLGKGLHMSVRAQAVAEVLWELKKAEKLGTYSLVAERAGFSAGTNGHTMITCMKKIRREWPHLEWWRVLEDGIELPKKSEQVSHLESNGYAMEAAGSDEKFVKPAELEDQLVDWSSVDGVEDAEEEEADAEEAVSS